MSKCIPFVLIVLDGWGYREETSYNAIAAAKTPHWDTWWKNYPHRLLEASGSNVGLPPNQMGNSEVGHMHIGAGRVILQDFSRINRAIEQGEFARNPAFLRLIEKTIQENKTLHVMGLLSPGGVHSHINHLLAFLELSAQFPKLPVSLHLFLDGRDTPPKSACSSLSLLETQLKQYPQANIRSITGRYYAMDRDKNWRRIKPLYQLLTDGMSEQSFHTAQEAMDYYYHHDISDEFIPPTQIGHPSSIKNGDSIFFFNFRADRARQLTEALTSVSFDGFVRNSFPKLTQFVSMTHYSDKLDTIAAFQPISLKHGLGEVIADRGLKQLRLAETEKYAHVTFFFNGGQETQFPLEDRILIPSPSVATYDMQPEMSAPEVTKTLINAILQQNYDFILCNYANADMVGHTGNLAATIQAIEYLDKALHEVWQALKQVGGHMLITADHGNAESMFDEATHQAHTAHTSLPVPLLYLGNGWEFKTTQGQLSDIAPTVLSLLGIPAPIEMTGHSLLVPNHVK